MEEGRYWKANKREVEGEKKGQEIEGRLVEKERGKMKEKV